MIINKIFAGNTITINQPQVPLQVQPLEKRVVEDSSGKEQEVENDRVSGSSICVCVWKGGRGDHC